MLSNKIMEVSEVSKSTTKRLIIKKQKKVNQKQLPKQEESEYKLLGDRISKKHADTI